MNMRALDVLERVFLGAVLTGLAFLVAAGLTLTFLETGTLPRDLGLRSPGAVVAGVFLGLATRLCLKTLDKSVFILFPSVGPD